MKLAVIIAAGGSSSRFGTKNKLLVSWHGLPLFCHSLRTFSAWPGGLCQVLVCPAAQLPDFAAALRRHLPDLADQVILVAGGDSRPASVLAGLQALPPQADIVAVHDAARPLATLDLLERCVRSAEIHGSGVAAHRMVDTVKEATADGIVERTLARHRLWGSETPQVFQRALVERAYAELPWRQAGYTDEAQMLEALPLPVRLVENRLPNLKITYRDDFSAMPVLPPPEPKP